MRKTMALTAMAAAMLALLAGGCGAVKTTDRTLQPPASVPTISISTQPTSSIPATSTSIQPTSSFPTTGGQSLASTSWVLVSYGVPSQLTAALPQAKVTLSFNADTTQISGSGGVNGYGGSVVLTGNQLAISGILHTEMASTDQAVNAQENAYFQLLSSAQSVSFGSGTLTINCAGGKVLIFNAA